MADQQSVLFDVDSESGVATLTLNRPARLNAINLDMVGLWRDALEEVVADNHVRALVITGAGRAFCAGGDIDDLEAFLTGDALRRKSHLWDHVQQIPLLLERIDCPVIAAINGTARGAGLDMALMCDLRIMDADAKVAESYIAMGIIPGDGGAWLLPRIVGMARALELLWTGDELDASRAYELGLVNRVVPAGQALSGALELAKRIAAQPSQPIRMIKRLAHQSAATGMSLRAHLDQASSHMSVIQDLPEFKDRLRQFRERRK